MATQTESSPTAQIVGNAFVQQYYSILHQSPEDVHKFYQDSSVLSRPGPDGVMTSVTTMQGINENIVSMEYKNYKVEILTADAQCSYQNGLVVLVTGYLTGKDNLRRKFSQTFFLAPQANGYFVLNDLFRYVDEFEVAGDIAKNDATLESAPPSPITPDPVPAHVASDLPAVDQTPPLVENTSKEEEVSRKLENGKESTTEKAVVSDHSVDSNQTYVPAVPETAPPSNQENTPKKSFASVVNALKDNTAPFHVRVSPVTPVAQVRSALASPVPEVSAPRSNAVVEKTEEHAAKPYAIFVPNLPMSATVDELRTIFSEYGSIKPNGIQVRSNKGSCFGFVEFESLTALQDALKASPITFADRKLFIEERRANNDRPRFPSGRVGYRNDNYRNENYRARGNFVGGRGHGKADFAKRGGYSSRTPRGNYEANGEFFQKDYQNRGGRPARETLVGVVN